MFRLLCVSIAMFLVVDWVSAEPREPGPHPPSQALKNPIESSDASLEAGKQVWQRDCAVCHGQDGRGETEMLEFLKTPPPDLTQGQFKYGTTDGEIFTVIRDGTKSDMTPFADKLPDQRIWHVVNFVKSLVVVEEDKAPAAAAEEALVNPFEMGDESVKRGKDVWQRFCAVCHGQDGKGETEMLEFLATPPPDFTTGEFLYGDKDADLFKVTRDGTSNDMEAFREKLTDENMWHVVNFIRSLGPKDEEPD